ncbi:hypothetical protein HAX54_007946 [Datura stramonium]|uniref:Uncharacterized protein n=1 Tax=Datura stramonium TaxID=4076 RepID=A0ABS8TDY2_DATST|nr:hypothetical protein [Datura stramonium]
MKYDFEKSKDETRYDMKFPKPVIEVFRSSGPSATIAEATTDLAEAATRTKSVSHAAQLPTSTPSTSVATTAQQGAELVETSSMVHPPSLYAFTPVNLAKARVNDKLNDHTMSDLQWFSCELKKAYGDILML